MTHEELLLQVRNLYLEAREPQFFYDKRHQAISRCTSHSISSEFEDLLAQYCYELIKEKSIGKDEEIQIFIDPQMTFPDLDLKNLSGKKTFLFRPDIVIVKNKEIVALLDAKTDLGFKKSTYMDMIKHTNSVVGYLVGKNAHFTPRTKQPKVLFTISNKIKLTYFVASSKWISKSYPIPDNEINKDYAYVNIFFLSAGAKDKNGHLNNYDNVEVGKNGVLLNKESILAFDSFILDAVNNQ